MTSLRSPSPPPSQPEPGPDSPSVPPTPLESPQAPDATTAMTATSGAAAGAAAGATTGAAADLAVIRDLLLKAYPDVVPDLVIGDSAISLLASVEPAREAYARVLAAIQANQANQPVQSTPSQPPPAIPAGGGAPLPIDPDRLPASEKIRRGLASGRRPA